MNGHMIVKDELQGKKEDFYNLSLVGLILLWWVQVLWMDPKAHFFQKEGGVSTIVAGSLDNPKIASSKESELRAIFTSPISESSCCVVGLRIGLFFGIFKISV